MASIPVARVTVGGQESHGSQVWLNDHDPQGETGVPFSSESGRVVVEYGRSGIAGANSFSVWFGITATSRPDHSSFRPRVTVMNAPTPEAATAKIVLYDDVISNGYQFFSVYFDESWLLYRPTDLSAGNAEHAWTAGTGSDTPTASEVIQHFSDGLFVMVEGFATRKPEYSDWDFSARLAYLDVRANVPVGVDVIRVEKPDGSEVAGGAAALTDGDADTWVTAVSSEQGDIGAAIVFAGSNLYAAENFALELDLDVVSRSADAPVTLGAWLSSSLDLVPDRAELFFSRELQDGPSTVSIMVDQAWFDSHPAWAVEDDSPGMGDDPDGTLYNYQEFMRTFVNGGYLWLMTTPGQPAEVRITGARLTSNVTFLDRRAFQPDSSPVSLAWAGWNDGYPEGSDDGGGGPAGSFPRLVNIRHSWDNQFDWVGPDGSDVAVTWASVLCSSDGGGVTLERPSGAAASGPELPFVDARVNPYMFSGTYGIVNAISLSVDAHLRWEGQEGTEVPALLSGRYAVILLDGRTIDPSTGEASGAWYFRQDVDVPIEDGIGYSAIRLLVTPETNEGDDLGYGPVQYRGAEGAANPDFQEFAARVRDHGVVRVVDLSAEADQLVVDVHSVDIVPAPLNPEFMCTDAPCGDKVIKYTVGGRAPQGYYVGPHGPAGAPHHGAFAIHPSGQVSYQAKLSPGGGGAATDASPSYWVQPVARFLSRAGDRFSTVAVRPIGLPVEVADVGWRQLDDWLGTVPSGSTHWLLQFVLTKNDPRVDAVTPPDEGSTLLLDCVYVREDGKDMRSGGPEGSVLEPYLDGDQPGGRWEGPPHNSTSARGGASGDGGDGDPTLPPATGGPGPSVPTPDPITGGDTTPPPPRPPRVPSPVPPSKLAELAFGRVTASTSFCVKNDIQLGDLVFNGIDESGIIWIVSDVDGWWTLPDPEIPDYPRGLADGSFESNGRYAARVFTVTGSFVPRSKSQVREARDRLIRAADLCHKGSWFATHEDDATRASRVWLSGRPEISTNSVNGRTDFSIGLKAPDPIKYGLRDRKLPGFYSVSMVSSTGFEASGRSYPREYPWSYQRDGDAALGNTAVVTNVGNARVSPVLRLEGPTYGPVVIGNRSTGQSMRVRLPLSEGETLVIDCLNKSVHRNTAPNQRWYLDTILDWIYLAPGENEFFYVDEASTSDGTLTVEWRPGWIG